MDWIRLARYRDRWKAIANTTVKILENYRAAERLRDYQGLSSMEV
jgi:hypothetical protein